MITNGGNNKEQRYLALLVVESAVLVAQHQQWRQGDASGWDPNESNAEAHPGRPIITACVPIIYYNGDNNMGYVFLLNKDLLRSFDAIIQGASDGPVAIHADHAQVQDWCRLDIHFLNIIKQLRL